MVNQITVPPPPPGSGNTYFVDYANGSDSNDGLSQSSPLKTCPANLQPGDTVEFKGGVEYKGTVNLSGGSENELITYKG